MNREVFENTVDNLLENPQYLFLNKFFQHGNTTCMLHSLSVTYFSLKFSDFLRLKLNKEALVKGALLHDFVLYDWHDKDSIRFHGFRHPYIASKNAKEIFNIGRREDEIIRKHMFPLTPLPPFTKESMVVYLVDKACSLYETFNRKNAYPKLRKYFKERFEKVEL